MERLTNNKPVEEMSMVELAHNCCYAEDRLARYRDFEMDMDARDFARNLMTTLTDDELSLDDENFDEEILENLQYDPFGDVRGLIALFYRNLWAMADLREKLKSYEDAEEQGLLLRLPCKVGDTVYTACSWGIESGVVGSIEIISDRVFVNNIHGAMIGEAHNIFLTKEEAEQALKLMGE